MLSLQRYAPFLTQTTKSFKNYNVKVYTRQFKVFKQPFIPMKPSFFANIPTYEFCSNNNHHQKYDELIQKQLNNAHVSSQNKNSIFTSKHYEINNDEIINFLRSLKMDYKVRPSGQIVTKYCPLCQKPHNNSQDNMYTLNFKPNSGAYFCFRCGSKGSWFDFKNHSLGDGKNIELSFDSINQASNKRIGLGPGSFSSSSSSSSYNPNTPEPTLASESLAFLRLQSTIQSEHPEVLKYLTAKTPEARHLSQSTLEYYRIGTGFETFLNSEGDLVELPCVYFPMYAPKSDKSVSKLRRKDHASDAKNSSSKSKLNLKAQIENNDSNEQQQIDIAQEKNVDEEEEQNSKNVSNHNYILVRNKVRAIYKTNKSHQRLEPSPGVWGLFGLNTVSPKSKVLVITEGEYDAMAVYEATKMPAISLPNGANHLPLQVLPWLEKFERIYLWMDADVVGQQNAQNFAQKLGLSRVHIVNTRKYDPNGPKDANDALRMDPNSLEQYLLEAKPVTQENITTFQEMKSQIFNRILRYDQNVGVQSDYFRWWNKKLKGFRRGEMTIVTGGTGSGKTSLLSQLSLDFSNQGIATLWGSFEVKNEILLTNMLLQYAGVNLYKENNKFEYHAENFEKIPLYFLKFFGSHGIDKIINTIEYAIYAFDIGHVVIDNLQFLLSGQGRGFERFDIQDDAISRFRELATTKNVHITVVIHPKKVDDNQDLTINSVFGSAKATQEADNIIIIQNRPKYRVIEIKKNRFDGDLGRVPLGFDRDSKRFFEVSEAELFDLHRNQSTIKEIIDKRKERNENYGLEEAKHEDQTRLEDKDVNKLMSPNLDQIREGSIPNLNQPITQTNQNHHQQQQHQQQQQVTRDFYDPNEYKAAVPNPSPQKTFTQSSANNVKKRASPYQVKKAFNSQQTEDMLYELEEEQKAPQDLPYNNNKNTTLRKSIDTDLIKELHGHDKVDIEKEYQLVAPSEIRKNFLDDSIYSDQQDQNATKIQSKTIIDSNVSQSNKKEVSTKNAVTSEPKPIKQSKASNTKAATTTKVAASKKQSTSSKNTDQASEAVGLYGDLYQDNQEDSKNQADTFYTNEDKDEVREKLEQYRNGFGNNKTDSSKFKKSKSMRNSIHEEIDIVNGKNGAGNKKK